MGLLQSIEAKGKQEKKRQFCLSLKTSTIDKIGSMAKQANVAKSFLAGEFLEAAINIEQSIGLDNYAQGYNSMNGLRKPKSPARGSK